MAFCVNCGSSYGITSTVCNSCYNDPKTAVSTWDDVLAKIEDTPIDTNFSDFSVPGEKLALITAILVTVIILLVASVVSFGLVLLLLIATLIGLRVSWVQSRAGMMEVTDDTFPQIYRISRLAAARLRVPMLPVFVMQDPTPNAYTTGMFQKNWIVVTSGLVELCTTDEILSVIGHELGHVRFRHVTWLVLTQPGVQVAGSIPNVFGLLQPLFNRWNLRSEYSADRAGLLASGDIVACVMMELKLMAGKALPDGFDVKAYLEKIMAEENKLEESIIEVLLHSHPFGKKRIRAMVTYFHSQEYKDIWNKCSLPGAMN